MIRIRMSLHPASSDAERKQRVGVAGGGCTLIDHEWRLADVRSPLPPLSYALPHTRRRRVSSEVRPVHDGERLGGRFRCTTLPSVANCPPLVVSTLRVSFMPFSNVGPCAPRSLDDEYASACAISSSLLQTEAALRLMTILPPSESNARFVYRSVSFPFGCCHTSSEHSPLHRFSVLPLLALRRDRCLISSPFILASSSSFSPSSASSYARDQHRVITTVVADMAVVAAISILLASAMSACRTTLGNTLDLCILSSSSLSSETSSTFLLASVRRLLSTKNTIGFRLPKLRHRLYARPDPRSQAMNVRYLVSSSSMCARTATPRPGRDHMRSWCPSELTGHQVGRTWCDLEMLLSQLNEAGERNQ
jgi:hypothetical protein